MPDYSKDTRDKACARLKSWGALVGAFNQTKFRTELGTKPVTTISGQSLGNGYCMGVGLDWIRRVLQSKAERDPNYLTYSYDALLKKEDMKDRTLQQLKDRTENTSLRMAHAYYRQNEEIVWKGPKGGETKSVPKDEWKKVASDLDSDFDETRGKSGRTRVKNDLANLTWLTARAKSTQNLSSGYLLSPIPKPCFAQVMASWQALWSMEKEGMLSRFGLGEIAQPKVMLIISLIRTLVSFLIMKKT